MSSARVLVICASKGGSTREITDEIALTLRGEGLDADVRLTAEVVDLAPYRAVVVGSAGYMMRWRSAAVRYLKKHRRALTERDVWLFQSGPLDRSAEEEEIPLPKSVARLAARIGAHEHATFGGRLGPGAEGFIAKKMVENGHGGDFRNFEQIRQWAKEIARELEARTVA